MHIEILGPLGAGKTTLAAKIAEKTGWRLESEMVEGHPFLKAFYANPALHAFETDAFFALDYFHRVKKAALGGIPTVFDNGTALHRGYFSLFDATPAEKKAFDALCAAVEDIAMPQAILHLTAPAQVMLERVKKRGRPFEAGVSETFIESLQARLAEHLEPLRARTRVLDIDVSRTDFVNNPADVEKVLDLLGQGNSPSVRATPHPGL